MKFSIRKSFTIINYNKIQHATKNHNINEHVYLYNCTDINYNNLIFILPVIQSDYFKCKLLQSLLIYTKTT